MSDHIYRMEKIAVLVQDAHQVLFGHELIQKPVKIEKNVLSKL